MLNLNGNGKTQLRALIVEEFSKRTSLEFDDWYEAKIQELAEFFTIQLEPDSCSQREIPEETVENPLTVTLAQSQLSLFQIQKELVEVAG